MTTIDSQLGRDSAPVRSNLADDAEFAELLEVFSATIPDKLKHLDALSREASTEELRAWAHQMKGTGGGYGFPGLSEAAAELETACKTGESHDRAQAVERLAAYLRRIEV
jgi:histidine phosphotransfer protein HptB